MFIYHGIFCRGASMESHFIWGYYTSGLAFTWWTTRPYVLLFVVVLILLPLVLVRRIDSLKFFSAASVLLAVVFVGISSVMSILAVFQGKAKKPRVFPDLTRQVSFFNFFNQSTHFSELM